MSRKKYYCDTWEFKKTKISHIIRNMYRGMKIRAKKKTLELCTYEEFKEFAFKNEQLRNLHKDWMLRNFEQKYAPSVDRKNNNKGYSINNIQFLTLSENSTKGNLEVHRIRIPPLQNKSVILEKDGIKLEFISGKEASLFLGFTRGAVSSAIKNNYKVAGWRPSYKY